MYLELYEFRLPILVFSVARGNTWEWLFVFLRLVESWRYYVRMFIRVRLENLLQYDF